MFILYSSLLFSLPDTKIGEPLCCLLACLLALPSRLEESPRPKTLAKLQPPRYHTNQRDCSPCSPAQGFLTIGADLFFAKGLREVIDKNQPAAPKEP